MLNFSETQLTRLVVHKCGNKAHEEELELSKKPTDISDSVSEVLKSYFLAPFKSTEYFHFTANGDLRTNDVFDSVANMFDDPEAFYDESVNLASFLYDISNHPKIKSGEFYVVQFSDCLLDDEITDAIGLFKSESRETFLKVYPGANGFEVSSENGINISKLDKGCLIFNTAKENGYLVSVVDNSGKGNDAQYWKELFLRVKPRKDDYFQTRQCINLCQSFVASKLPEEFEVSKADQADLLKKSEKYFKEKEAFTFEDFSQDVFREQPELAESFNNYKEVFEETNDIQFNDTFEISEPAVKKQSKVFKSIIKLDKNFHIYVHGAREKIVRGHDPSTGLHYYQLFFEEES